jgi:hypothetical protein
LRAAKVDPWIAMHRISEIKGDVGRRSCSAGERQRLARRQILLQSVEDAAEWV